MFGRVRRAVDARYPGSRRPAAVLRVYSPDATSALAVGMGAAAVGSGSAMVTLPDGRQVADWMRGSFTATEEDFLNDRSVRVVVDGKRTAILSGSHGPLHPSVRRTIRDIVGMSNSA